MVLFLCWLYVNSWGKPEKRELDNRLRKIKDTEIAKKLKVAQYTISEMFALITAMMINATRPLQS